MENFRTKSTHRWSTKHQIARWNSRPAATRNQQFGYSSTPSNTVDGGGESA